MQCFRQSPAVPGADGILLYPAKQKRHPQKIPESAAVGNSDGLCVRFTQVIIPCHATASPKICPNRHLGRGVLAPNHPAGSFKTT
jgi:hypothetical protein